MIPHMVVMLLDGMALQDQTLNHELSTKILTALKTFKL